MPSVAKLAMCWLCSLWTMFQYNTNIITINLCVRQTRWKNFALCEKSYAGRRQRDKWREKESERERGVDMLNVPAPISNSVLCCIRLWCLWLSIYLILLWFPLALLVLDHLCPALSVHRYDSSVRGVIVFSLICLFPTVLKPMENNFGRHIHIRFATAWC